MTYLALILLLFVHFVAWAVAGNTKIQHSPVKISTLLSGIHTIPHYIICTIDPEKSFLYASMGSDYLVYFVQFGILYSIAFLLHTFFLIIAFKAPIPFANKLPLKDDYPYERMFIICLLSYLILYVLTSNSIGGLSNYLGNFIQRHDLRAGTGIFDMFRLPFAYLTIMFLVVSYKDKPNASLKINFLIISMALLESLFGGRRNPIQFLIFGYLGYLLVNKEQRLRPMSAIFIGIFIVGIFVGSYYFRTITSLQGFSPTFTSSQDQISIYLLNLSYNDIYIFVMSHFNESNFWYGSVFGDIFLKFSTWLAGSAGPSPDEGVYIYNLYQGTAVEPPMLLDQMYHNSWPPRTFGNGYLNFGITGVFIFFCIKGALIGLAFKALYMSRNNPFIMYIYFYMIFSFQLSNLKIFELITMSIALFIVVIFLRFLSYRKVRFF